MTIAEAEVALPTTDGLTLRGRRWSADRPVATLVISHGLGEHGGTYRAFAAELIRAVPLDVLAFDYRGSGRSPGRRGVVRRYDDLADDLAAALGWMAAERPGLPRFAFGHSNGALAALWAGLDRDLGLAGLVVSNPPIRLAGVVPVWKRWVGRFLLRTAPWVTLSTGLSSGQMTRDPDALATHVADPLRHNRISPPLYFGMAEAGPTTLDRAEAITVPTLLILGADDPIIDLGAARLLFDRLGATDKTLRSYPNRRHEPIHDLGREEVIADVAAWLRDRLGAMTSNNAS